MNVNELMEKKLKALDILKKDNVQLIAMGVDEKKISKIRAQLKGTIDRCEIILNDTKRHNIYISDIDGYVAQMSEFGLKTFEPKKETIIDTAPEKVENYAKQRR